MRRGDRGGVLLGAVQFGTAAVVEALLDTGADPNKRNSAVVHAALLRNDLGVLLVLEKHGYVTRSVDKIVQTDSGHVSAQE